ncbi:flagellar M-ring protein FliF [Rhodospirillum rubrum]|uniref:flagellar basal-body MS-ring/collar protein FliF n=1 Tax=Rhodospirillum rubrum TaxID=1085 RepID=UPI001908DE9A|nr:flagellar basal-body MS-ring/collar protein FliF [Rhodospirillum rubrum]MBK1665444.1 flagellar M-ring protein FliF [Rhodospirillum rubrum]MBK1677361.1 flagellar M-ring protein FliF [Rhodospirillum rubrum]
MNSFVQTMRNLGPVRLAALAGVAIALIGFVIYVASRLSGTSMELLYGDLAPSDAKQIIAQLEERNIPFQMANDGRSVLVPSDQVLKLRVQMAESALPSGATVGYEIFDSASALGSTQFTQNINMVRALEGELARTVRTIQGVEGARVHLVLPKREPFTRDQVAPSASVVLLMKGRRLQPEQVVAVQNLVAAAVPGMKPGQVSIIDERGTLLTRGMGEEGALIAQNQDEMRKAEERRLAQSIEQLLERTIGVGKVRAEVVADMDFNRIVTSRESFDPNGQVVRSTTTVDEQNKSSDAASNVSVQQNLPEAQFAGNGGAPTSQTSENRTEETVNYEITKIVTNEIKEAGVVKRLSVAVMVDGTSTTDDAGNTTWQPRSDDEMQKITSLVRSAMGYDQTRGDQIEVVNMQFIDPGALFDDAAAWEFLGFTKAEVMKMAEGLGVAVVAILIILLVVRPLVQRAFENLPSGADQGGAGLLTAEMQGHPQLTGPGGGSIPAGMLGMPDEMDDAEELIDIDKVEGRVKASSLRKIGEIVDKHPEEALSIIRNWLYQES